MPRLWKTLSVKDSRAKKDGSRRGDRSQRPFLVERLDERVLFVVGALDLPTVVEPGPDFGGIVEISTPTGTCSGTLLKDGRHVLTAAHCMDFDIDSDGDGVLDRGDGQIDAGNSEVRFNLKDANGDRISARVRKIVLAPGWTGDWKANDIALVQLETEAPDAVRRFDLYRRDSEVGQLATLMGWGKMGSGTASHDSKSTGAAGWREFSGEGLHAGTNTIDEATNGGSYLQFDLDDSGSTEAILAPGDSGGPVFIDGLVAGVNSYSTLKRQLNSQGEANYHEGNAYGELSSAVRVSSYADWLDRQMANDLLADADAADTKLDSERLEVVFEEIGLANPHAAEPQASPPTQRQYVSPGSPYACPEPARVSSTISGSNGVTGAGNYQGVPGPGPSLADVKSHSGVVVVYQVPTNGTITIEESIDGKLTVAVPGAYQKDLTLIAGEDLTPATVTVPSQLLNRVAIYGQNITVYFSIRSPLTSLQLLNMTGANTIIARKGTVLNELFIKGSGGDDTIDLNGIVKANKVSVNGGAGDDIIQGSNFDDVIDGGAGNDMIFGRGGDDTIYGGDGADKLYGEWGNDTLDGGLDLFQDLLWGEEGQDTFTVNIANQDPWAGPLGVDLIMDLLADERKKTNFLFANNSYWG